MILATEQLDTLNFDPTYTSLFFSYISSQTVPLENRLHAAIYFKNAVDKYWCPEDRDQDRAFRDDTKKYIKENLAKLLTLNPKKIGENLAAIAGTIGKEQLNTEWPAFIGVRPRSHDLG